MSDGTDDFQFDFIEYLGQGLAIFDPSFKLLHYNGKFLEALDLNRDDIFIGMPFAELIRLRADRGDYGPDINDEKIAQFINKVRFGDAACLRPNNAEKKNIRPHICKIHHGAFLVSFDTVANFDSVNIDLNLIDLIGQELFVFEADTLFFTYVNRHVLENLKFPMTDLKKMTPLDIKPLFNHFQFRKLLQEVRQSEEKHFTFETVHRRADDTVYPVEIYLQYNPDTEPDTFTSVVRDITVRKRAEETIRNQAQIDALTGLPNRTVFFDRLVMAQLQADRENHLVALHFLDLDNFKNVNDSRGHGIGDILLNEVGKRLKQVVRKSDTIARLGGDEFAIIQSRINNVDDAEMLASKVLRALSDPFDIANNQLFIGASMGITIYPFDDQTPEELLRNADIAMYEAKNRGRNGFAFYDINMSDAIRDRNELEQDLHGALEKGEYFLVYQPKVLNSSGDVVGMEALVRWRHPSRGVILPTDFIPIAESTGLIVELGAWVLREAASQAVSWQDQGMAKLIMAVNLSAVQFRDAHLIELIRSTLEETGLDPTLLEIEITESTAMDDASNAARILDSLKAIGVRISLDDFGTGYSSLAYLKRFPLDTIKIDMSFIHDILTSSNDAAIVQAVINMGQALDMTVIAEGVETGDQYAHLADSGCDEVQGYYFSKPVRAEDFPALIRNYKS
ncbi:MAG TPA: EAL domain-containing protein [Rhodospirillales bacterium]|nr:EAL domain-containing protein [Rhodospirillales bacterium]